MVEKLRSEILASLANKVDNEILTDFKNQLDVILYNYNVSIKSTELVVVDTSNSIILKNFLGTKKLEGCSNKTIEYYRYIMNNLLESLQKNIPDISTNDIRYYLANYQIEKEVSTTTINNMRFVYCSFFNWCYLEKYIKENPMTRITKIKIQKKQVEPFTESELEKMFSACNNTRDRALLEFLYSTGCRVSECSAVDISDIDFKNKTVLIRKGKGNKQRISYISDKCMIWLEKYLDERNSNDIALWTGKKGRLSKAGIECIVRKVGERAGIHAHPHKFRHTLATNMVKRNAPVQIVQKVLGHENLNTSMIYITVDDNDVESAHKKYV
jgi:site-specific recombinase XerD